MAPAVGFRDRAPPLLCCSCHVSHDTPNAGVDPLAALPRDGEGIVKWPILAQLPWVGEPELQDELAASPIDILPFGEPTPQPYTPPTFNEADTLPPPLRIVDPNLPQGEAYAYSADSETIDRRLHRASPAGRTAAEPPHVNVRRFPTASPVAASESEQSRRPVGEPTAPRQHRRFDPPQPRYGEGIALHQPNDSLAAQLYQWQATRKSQTALFAMCLLLLTGGGLYVASTRLPAAAPKEVAEPPAWEIEPLKPVIGGVNETLATPLPASPALDLSTEVPSGPTAEPTANDPSQPVTTKTDAEAEDPIAAWLNKQPPLPQLTASKDAVEIPTPGAKPVETKVEKPIVPPAAPAVEPQLTSQPEPDHSITPTPATPTPATPSLTSPSPYETTPYPPFPATLAPPSSNVWPAAVAETPGPAFGPPQPPR